MRNGLKLQYVVIALSVHSRFVDIHRPKMTSSGARAMRGFGTMCLLRGGVGACS
jgi:hypothetical protein